MEAILTLVGGKQKGGFTKQLNTGLKSNQIYQYILTGSIELPKESTPPPSSSSSASLSQTAPEEEVVDCSIVEATSSKRKVFLYNTTFLESQVKDNSVDLLITDIPYNVSNEMLTSNFCDISILLDL